MAAWLQGPERRLGKTVCVRSRWCGEACVLKAADIVSLTLDHISGSLARGGWLKMNRVISVVAMGVGCYGMGVAVTDGGLTQRCLLRTGTAG
ncbi:hypothetical protein MHYP_G00121510 [Metynnis hypsauchen]